MKSGILATILVVGTITTAAFAYTQDCPNLGQKGSKSGYGMQQGMMNQQGMSGYGMHQGMMNQQDMHGYGTQGFKGVKLTNEQSNKLTILRDEMRLEMRKLMGANLQQHHMINFVTDKGFNKDTFIKNMDERHQQMSQIRAAHFEKVFKILTPEQINEQKNNLEAK